MDTRARNISSITSAKLDLLWKLVAEGRTEQANPRRGGTESVLQKQEESVAFSPNIGRDDSALNISDPD